VYVHAVTLHFIQASFRASRLDHFRLFRRI